MRLERQDSRRTLPRLDRDGCCFDADAQGGDATFRAAFLRRPRPGVRSAAGNEAVIIAPVSLADDFHQHALGATPVEFAVEHLLPRTEVEPAGGTAR